VAQPLVRVVPEETRVPGARDTVQLYDVTALVRGRLADFGVQIFNVTSDGNPRDVYQVAGAPHSGAVANSVGPIIGGYALLTW
jgi:hypothetical protein